MIKLKSIYIDGLHNAINKTYQLNDMVYFYGRNGAGKTTVLNAIQLALLGYIPGVHKNRESILKHSPSGKILVRLELLDNGNTIVIERQYNEKASKTSVIPEGYDIKSITADIELPIFNFNEFIGQTANKLKDYFIQNLLPMSDGDLDWREILKSGMTDLAVENPEEVLAYGLDLISGISGSPIDQVMQANTKFKEMQTFNKSELSRLQATVNSLIYYSDYVGPKNMDEITANILKLNVLRDALIRYDSAAKTINSNKEELASLEKTYTDMGGKDIFIQIRDQMNLDVKQYDALKQKIDALSSSMAYLKAKKTTYEDIIAQNGVCPYTKSQCTSMNLDSIEHELIPTVDNNIKELNRQLTDLCMRFTELDTGIQQSRSKLTNFQTIINKISALRGLVQTLPEKPDTDKSIADIDQEIREYDDAKMKLQANIVYESTIEKLTALKYKTELNNSALVAWIKLTDTNGLQTSLAEKPFAELTTTMTGYIQAMYGDNTLGAKFDVSAKSNAFSFGLIRNDNYIAYEQLSSGEKCLYALALMVCIINKSKSPLKLLLCDDMFDHLDNQTIENTFASLKYIPDTQFIFAGVKDCCNASDVIINI